MTLNRCSLLGTLADDPQFRSAGSSRVMALRVVTVESWKDRQSGETRARSDYHSVEVWSADLIELGETVLRRGSLVFVEGMLKNQKWTGKDGQERLQTVVSVRPYSGSMSVLDGASGSSDAPAPRRRPRSKESEMWEDVMGTDSPF